MLFTCLLCAVSLWLPARSYSKDKHQKTLRILKRTVGAYGGITALLRESGKLVGLVKLYTGSDTPQEGEITVQFKRKFRVAEDLKRIDLTLPTAPKLTIGFDGKHIWGMENDAPIVLYLRSEAAFKADIIHNYEAFLRSQELGAELVYIGQEKKSGIRLHVIDMKHADGSTTRFYISAKTWRILHLEYEFSVPSLRKPIHVRQSYYDFRVVQQTLVPFRVVRYEDDHLVQEIRYTGVAFNVQIKDAVFKPGGGGDSAKESR